MSSGTPNVGMVDISLYNYISFYLLSLCSSSAVEFQNQVGKNRLNLSIGSLPKSFLVPFCLSFVALVIYGTSVT